MSSPTLYSYAVVTIALISYTSAQDIRLPPFFTAQPPESLYIKSGENIQLDLPCAASGTPEPNYLWMKNGYPMSYTTYTYIVPRTGNLHFEVPTTLDEGYYQCMAENQNGKVMSTVTQLTKIMLGQFSDISTVTRVHVDVGEPIHLTCHAPKSVPPPRFEWGLVREGSDPTSPTILTQDKRIQTDAEGNLMISNAHLQDAQSGYNYVCQARNNDLLSASGGSLHKVTVSGSSATNSVPRIMYHSTGPVVGIVGDTATLQCFFSGYPTPNVSWKKQVGNLPSGRAVRDQFDTQLEIRNIEFGDAGTYICTASNSAGQSTETEIEFDVQSRPSFKYKSAPVNMNATVNDEAVIKCDANAVPAAEVQWYMNGDPLDASYPPSRFLIEENTLRIRKVCKDCVVPLGSGERTTDLMVIQCNASNNNGYVFGQGYLNVLNTTILTQRPPTNAYLGLEEFEIRLPCQGATDDATDLVLTWMKGTDPIKSIGDDRLMQHPNGELHIDLTGLSVEEKGPYQDDYTCKVSNGYSEEVAITTVEIAGAPKPVAVASAGFPLWMIIVIVAVALLLLIIILCCCICAKRGKGDVYDVDLNERKKGSVDPEDDKKVNSFKEYVRPDYTGTIKGSRASLTSSIPLDSDDDGMTDMYGDPDIGRFGEDGSFLGQYATDKKKSNNIYDNNHV